ncbi:MAG TPA: Uma2 family endonuclease [Tepidisphaeraceae bacterium]|jgi:Uma2 family endonuclease|nr:Uma2 family endonuclease [Tepidisphaeraceae bacterium]
MTLAQLPSLTGHAVLHGVSWGDYEKLLSEIGDGDTRITYLDGSMEIMSPLPEHEDEKKVIARLVEELTIEAALPNRGFGSATFRREDRQSGLEPDECFYIQNESRVRGMKRFDPKKYPPPDLAIEIDVTRRSVPKEPVYARLGVPEIWRFDGRQLSILLLADDGTYRQSEKSLIFPFLPLDSFVTFAHRMLVEEPNGVIREFRKWAGGLAFEKPE